MVHNRFDSDVCRRYILGIHRGVDSPHRRVEGWRGFSCVYALCPVRPCNWDDGKAHLMRRLS